FEKAIATASLERLNISTEIISELNKRKSLVDFYNQLDDTNYPLRIMHHDSKISNILFSSLTGDVKCIVDLDTIMPGKFFSDLGDMIRSMACSVNENKTEWEKIFVKEDHYKSIIEGYIESMEHSFTTKETEHMHYAGPIMIYMQSLRFITDFLNNDIYYHTNYKNQNFNRAKNQLVFLMQLEAFLKKEYNILEY
ncbi:MAG TPA: phosphotransferase, partial [Parafilimonas sp.]|nr:phosphotransferase [Parafilimonas sp.]